MKNTKNTKIWQWIKLLKVGGVDGGREITNIPGKTPKL
jgi:hypothetical protein